VRFMDVSFFWDRYLYDTTFDIFAQQHFVYIIKLGKRKTCSAKFGSAEQVLRVIL